MGNLRGVKRDFQALEKRRLTAYKLIGEGMNNSEIGRQLSICNQTVSRWRQQSAGRNAAALKAAGRAGRKPLLDAQQRAVLTKHLLAGPEQSGYPTPLWTCERVARLIEKEFGIRYHPGHVWKVLRQMNWSPQRPVGRALERNEQTIAEWKQTTWPAIKKKPVNKGARLSSSTKAG